MYNYRLLTDRETIKEITHIRNTGKGPAGELVLFPRLSIF